VVNLWNENCGMHVIRQFEKSHDHADSTD